MIKLGRISVSLELRQVFLDGLALRVGSRAFDVFETLARADGRTVTKAELIRQVWPSTIVQENNLNVHVSSLRRLFESERDVIQTVPGRGYRLVSPGKLIVNLPDTDEDQSDSSTTVRLTRLPHYHAPLIGRDSAIGDVRDALGRAPIVTLLGPGGIGKTRLGIETARVISCAEKYEVCFVALAEVQRSKCIVQTLANALGIEDRTRQATIQTLSSALDERKLLIVLDNCEHVIESAAALCDVFLQFNPNVQILATSREPLRVRDETLYWVPTLDTSDVGASSSDILASSAVRVFLSRTREFDAKLALDDDGIELISTICRRLDGLPLAIELAAARASFLGIGKLVEELDDRFRALVGGSRTAPARQQSLEAALDWSYQFLTGPEELVFRRLGVFGGQFELDAACLVASCDEFTTDQVVEAAAGLISKCFLRTESHGPIQKYFFLETIREYALKKLYDSGESSSVYKKHADYLDS